MTDNVNHPSHYEKSCSIECIDAMELFFGKKPVFWFCLCNAFKYTWRWKFKNGEEDLQKAKWYLKRAETTVTTIGNNETEIIARLKVLVERYLKEIKI